VFVPLGTVRSLYSNGPRGSIDGVYIVTHVRMDPRTSPKPLRRHHNEFGAIVDFSSDEIREPTICKRDVRPAFEHVDFGCFVNAAGAGSGGGATSNATHNENTARSSHKDF
jgi:hypothetical protein